MYTTFIHKIKLTDTLPMKIRTFINTVRRPLI